MKKKFPARFTPFFKSYFEASLGPLQFFEYLVKSDDIVRLPVLRTNYLVNHPEAIYHILLTNQENYTKLGTSYERIEHAIGKGLLTTSGEEWHERRERYQHRFQGRHLSDYIESIHHYTEHMLNQWERKNHRLVDVSDEMLALVMNISSKALLGVDVSSHTLELVRYIHILNVHSVRSLILWKWFPTFRNIKYQAAKRYIDKFLMEHLQRESPCDITPILNNLLVKDEQGELLLPEEEILGEVKNFFIAGHETTGNALSWTLYCLAKHPYVLLQVLNEIKTNLGTKTPDHDTLDNLPYLEMVIKESLRLFPPIWIFTRKAVHEDTLLDYTLPAGGIVNILPYLIHRHPRYWHQPKVFYPERFAPNIISSRPKCAYLPFGFGPRVCIGQQFALLNLKIILPMILQRFTLHLPHKDFTLVPEPFITLKPPQNFRLRIEPSS